MPPDSFTFAVTNSLDFGIKVIAYDVFSAAKRDRHQIIPFRHGANDQGRKFYNNRILRLGCHMERQLSKVETREVIHWLSQKSVIRLWDEPDKFYVGELLESVAVEVFSQRVLQQFELPFVCEPFAYGRQITQQIQQGNNAIDYEGTIETPTMLVIRNPNNFPITGIVVRAIKSRR